ncbi:MAG TPA: hypothetical protein PLU67_07505 [Candidatus Kapabacteria bacterium]|jgi:hypothetical protein|nr:hypothetical protein [Candidatus Kapabacteria bacterium]
MLVIDETLSPYFAPNAPAENDTSRIKSIFTIDSGPPPVPCVPK